MGHDVAIVSAGTQAGSENVYRFAAAGAPGAEYGQGIGVVEIVEADVSTGELDVPSTMNQRLFPPAMANSADFGWALQAADVRECFHGTSATLWDACGEELLVGNPDWSATPGSVAWFHIAADGFGTFIPGGTITPPGAYPAGARFGYALASWVPYLDRTAPWMASPNYPSWIAVGAPSIDRVAIYSVTATATSPFTFVQDVIAPIAGGRFGAALAAGDFTGDGIGDLAVGAPQQAGTNVGGRVYVYAGTGGSPPLAATPRTLSGAQLYPGGTVTQDDGYGTSLAAGSFFPVLTRDALVVGAPAYDVTNSSSIVRADGGGACAVLFDPCTGSTCVPRVAEANCSENPYKDSRNITNEEFGAAVAVTDLLATDSLNQYRTDQAKIEEIVVGVPGYDGDRGEVLAFLPSDHGPRWLDLAAQVREYPGSVAGARFGAAVDGGYVQERRWGDVLVGAPDDASKGTADGAVSLTLATTVATCTDIEGVWETTDSRGNARSVSITVGNGKTRIIMVDTYIGVMRDNYGASTGDVCGSDTWDPNGLSGEFSLGAGFEIELPSEWVCGITPQSWSGIDAEPLLREIAAGGIEDETARTVADGAITLFIGFNGAQEMDVEIALDTTTSPPQLELALDLNAMSWAEIATVAGGSWNEECRPERLPWTFEQNGGSCED